jgi:hypothetical protein
MHQSSHATALRSLTSDLDDEVVAASSKLLPCWPRPNGANRLAACTCQDHDDDSMAGARRALRDRVRVLRQRRLALIHLSLFPVLARSRCSEYFVVLTLSSSIVNRAGLFFSTMSCCRMPNSCTFCNLPLRRKFNLPMSCEASYAR